jgi:hypothetical protein
MCYLKDKPCLIIKQPKFGLCMRFQCSVGNPPCKERRSKRTVPLSRAMSAGFPGRALLERCCLVLIFLG